MVFHPEGQFHQFPHCKFRENIVRLLYIPSIVHINGTDTASSEDASSQLHQNHLFLAVNKFGKVGLYHPEKFSLVHTYCLDLSVPMHPQPGRRKFCKNKNPPPKCERTHLITDAAFSEDTLCVIFATTKLILQWYDIGEIQKQDIGLGLFPRREFFDLRESTFPVITIPNKGHVESHRLFGLNFTPSCLEYQKGRLFIGDVDGGITIISIPNPVTPLGRRKIRGTLHQLLLNDLPLGTVHYYKGHKSPVTDIHFLAERNLILSTSKDKKFSVFVKDITDTVDNIIVSISKGVNSLAYSSSLKMIGTGSDDQVVRLFSQFIMKMPQMELFGHRSPVLAVEFVQVDPSLVTAGDNSILLLSYSADTEIRAWDPITFICLQSLYLSFPVGSTIMCKTPEFARKSLLSFAKQSVVEESDVETGTGQKTLTKKRKSKRDLKQRHGVVILLYCNSYAKIPLEKDGGSKRWPFDYDEFIHEFEELSMEYEKKLKQKLKTPTQPAEEQQNGAGCNLQTRLMIMKQASNEENGIPELVEEEKDVFPEEAITSKSIKKRGENEKIILSSKELSDIDSRLDKYVKEILELRREIKEDSERSGTAPTGRPIMAPQNAQTPSGRRRSRSGSVATNTMDSSSAGGGVMSPPDGEHFSISVQATNKYFEFKRGKLENLPKSLHRQISYGQAFNRYPIMELEPIQFQRKNLPIPDTMKNALGLKSINSVQEMFTPEAAAYFGLVHHHHRKCGVNPGSKTGNDREEKSLSRSRNIATTSANRFTVVGHKLHNVYEEELPPTIEEDEINYDYH